MRHRLVFFQLFSSYRKTRDIDNQERLLEFLEYENEYLYFCNYFSNLLHKQMQKFSQTNFNLREATVQFLI